MPDRQVIVQLRASNSQDMNKPIVQFASFIATKGTAVQVNDAATMVPEAQMEVQPVSDLKERGSSSKGKGKSSVTPSNRLETIGEPGPGDKLQNPNRFE